MRVRLDLSVETVFSGRFGRFLAVFAHVRSRSVSWWTRRGTLGVASRSRWLHWITTDDLFSFHFLALRHMILVDTPYTLWCQYQWRTTLTPPLSAAKAIALSHLLTHQEWTRPFDRTQFKGGSLFRLPAGDPNTASQTPRTTLSATDDENV